MSVTYILQWHFRNCKTVSCFMRKGVSLSGRSVEWLCCKLSWKLMWILELRPLKKLQTKAMCFEMKTFCSDRRVSVPGIVYPILQTGSKRIAFVTGTAHQEDRPHPCWPVWMQSDSLVSFLAPCRLPLAPAVAACTVQNDLCCNFKNYFYSSWLLHLMFVTTLRTPLLCCKSLKENCILSLKRANSVWKFRT
jgi:hypothetical protein